MSRHSPTQIFVHIVWATLQRRAVLASATDGWFAEFIKNKAGEHDSRLVAIGCAPDHVHSLLELAPSVALSQLVQRFKGGSAYAYNRNSLSGEPLRWQAGYWCESVSPSALASVEHYVRHQRQHHAKPGHFEKWFLLEERSGKKQANTEVNSE